MRIPRLLILLAVTAALAGCTGQENPANEAEWEPDDGLQRAQAALKDEDTSARRLKWGAPHVGSGIHETLETSGDRPYRFNVVCDSPDVPRLAVTLTRGASKKQADVTCSASSHKQVVRISFPAGEPVTVTVEPATGEPTPMGLIAWDLKTVDPTNVQGCADEIDGCKN
ncbi:hypothetical protein EDE04_7426 [Streptomyces sp. 2132.2]|uniref:hypothetical protein n=1 Tax=Streptomyces sp. 2132.2 TaxID=2485161 RepID=UPI000F95265E|nr:hypothetical protein [Streptomyces sp. 2132.2]ROQ89027.1 hypothetical protein EDE04_7426 [Streptomyces sp. 2132.2]